MVSLSPPDEVGTGSSSLRSPKTPPRAAHQGYEIHLDVTECTYDWIATKNGQPVAILRLMDPAHDANDQNDVVVLAVEVAASHRGKGLPAALLTGAITEHKRVLSDVTQSPNAAATWLSLVAARPPRIGIYVLDPASKTEPPFADLNPWGDDKRRLLGKLL